MTALEVGSSLPGRMVPLTREHIRRYAAASGDDNPIHLDEDAARGAGLPGVIAHGMLSMGLLGSVATMWAGEAKYVRKVGCRFASVVRPDDVLTYSGIVTSITDGLVEAAVTVVNQRNEPVLSRGVVVFESPAV